MAAQIRRWRSYPNREWYLVRRGKAWLWWDPNPGIGCVVFLGKKSELAWDNPDT